MAAAARREYGDAMDAKARKCPHDGSALVREEDEAGIEVDECPECDGVWLDHGELERIQETVEIDYRRELEEVPDTVVQAYKNARGEEARKPLPCPSCNSELTAKEHGYCSQIMVDVCPSCRGVWLDAGELDALEIFFERSKLETRLLRNNFWQGLKTLIMYGPG
jgi:Zn-finger nucleic acid-binding protein